MTKKRKAKKAKVEKTKAKKTKVKRKTKAKKTKVKRKRTATVNKAERQPNQNAGMTEPRVTAPPTPTNLGPCPLKSAIAASGGTNEPEIFPLCLGDILRRLSLQYAA